MAWLMGGGRKVEKAGHGRGKSEVEGRQMAWCSESFLFEDGR